MNAKTKTAIESALRAAGEDDFTLEAGDDTVTVTAFISTDGYTDPDYGDEVPAGRSVDFVIEAHRLDNGRWILARWSERHNQWQSSDFSARFQRYNKQAVYCFARKIENLAGDIRTYEGPTAAIKSALADRIAA